MATNSHIEWTDASWNCLAGCEAVSPGCAHCYAATMTRRLEAMGQKDYAGLTTDKHFNGTVRCLPDKLAIPLRWRKPRRVFVNSMSDLFHEDVPDEFIDRVFAVMALCPQHTFQVLTKRAARMQRYMAPMARKFGDAGPAVALSQLLGQHGETEDLIRKRLRGEPLETTRPLSNVWLGVSVEDQKRKDRMDFLRQTPAAVRFLSCEPLLEDLGELDLEGIHWVIAGGESGHGARPCDLSWIRSIIDQCQDWKVPCFVKQIGSHAEEWDTEYRRPGFGPYYCNGVKHKKGGDPAEWPEELRVRQFPENAHA